MWPKTFRQIDPNRTINELLNITVVPGYYSDPQAVKMLKYKNLTY